MAKRSTTARGYGSSHQKRRKRWAREVARGAVCCWRCGGPIAPGARWDLGHLPDGKDTRPEHVRCNRSAGGKVRANQLYGRETPTHHGAPAPEPGLVARPLEWGDLPDPTPDNTSTRWSRHWSGGEFNPRCPRCLELGSICEVAAKWALQERDAAA